MTPLKYLPISVGLLLATVFTEHAFAAKADTITFKPVSSTYVAGGSGKVVLGAVAASRAGIHYQSSDSSVLLIDDSTGSGTIRKPGTVTVTASTTSTPAGYTAARPVTAKVTIAKAAAPNITPSASISKAVYVPGSTVTIGNPLPSDYGGTISYTITGPASVNAGLVTFNETGSVKLTLTASPSPNYLTPAPSTVQLTVANRGTATIGSVSFANASFAPNASVTIPTPPLYPSGASGGTWSYTTTSTNASISGNTITLKGAGPVPVTAEYTPSQNSQFNKPAKTLIGTLNVNKGIATIVGQITISEAKFAPNLKVSIPTPTLSPNNPSGGAGTWTYSTTATNATISGSSITLTGAGSVPIIATWSGNSNYNATPQATVGTLSVAKGNDSITKTPIAAPAPGASVTLPALKSLRGQPVVYSPGAGSGGATVAGGKVTPSNNGRGQITVDGTTAESANYKAASMITYVIGWNYNPSSKLYSFSAQ